MMRVRSLLAATAAATMAVAAIAAAPAADATDVSVAGDTVTVTGTVTDGLGTTVIGVDPLGDATGSGYGVDVVEYGVSFPRPNVVAFGLAIGDANPATGHGPQSVEFSINPTVGSQTISLTASATLDGGLRLGAETCAVDPATGVNNCTTSEVPGGYADGVITWELTTVALPGAGVNGGAVEVNPTITTASTGGVIFNGGLYDAMSISALARVPSAELLIDGEIAGTGRLSDEGFTVSASGLAAGEHTAAVQLCGGAADFQSGAAECSIVDLGTITVEATA